jgi:hypothetical protein
VHSRLHEEKISVELEGLKITTSFEVDDINGIPFNYCEVRKEINKLKLGKAGGKDGLTNEHLKYGGSVLVSCLTQLFNAMYKTESVPSAMKRGLIYTLYKGCKKYEDDRKNYRGISLMPVISKLFERLLLNRIKNWLSANNICFPSINQNAYQETLCSLLTSFELQECISYNLERESKVYVCFLDASSAFDTVWHNGLFVKLHKLGVTGKTWKLLFNSYQGMISNVVISGKLSAGIHVKQSVRQGSILGP